MVTVLHCTMYSTQGGYSVTLHYVQYSRWLQCYTALCTVLQVVTVLLVGGVVRPQDESHCPFLHLIQLVALGEVEGTPLGWGSISQFWEHQRGIDGHQVMRQCVQLLESW